MGEPAVEFLLAFDAFLQEHRRCGTIDGSSEGPFVWLSCSCSGLIIRMLGSALEPSPPPPQ
jgi:hypothetical protein